jgi:ABC-type sugar transport system ATPase subunit
MIIFRGVSKTYQVGRKAVAALRSVDLQLHAREFSVILGPSGSGKTTLLNGAAGLLVFDEGDVYLRGKRSNLESIRARKIAMVMQGLGLYPQKSVRSNIDYPLRIAQVDKATRRARTEEILALLGLQGEADRLPRYLSGGQRQRVAIGRALAKDVDILFLDEPFSDLDAQHRFQLRRELKALHLQRGLTTVLVTHDQEDALALADRITLMRDGRVVEVGSPHELYSRPRTAFAARFLGRPPMNLVEGRVINGSFIASSLADRLPLADLAFGTAAPEGTGVVLGLRPEDIAIGGGPAVWEVREIQPAGYHDILQVSHQGLQLYCMAEPGHQVTREVLVGVRAVRRPRLFLAETGESVERN